MELILFLAGVFLVTYLLGRFLESIRVPWLFSALLIGFVLSIYNPFYDITSSSSFAFLAELGLYFLLFIIGFELDLNLMMGKDKFILKSAIAVIGVEALAGAILLHYIFDLSWLIAVVVASSFATVGEAVLLPILDEFKLTKTRFGQTVLGIGVIDDVIELMTILAVIFMVSRTAGHAHLNIEFTLALLTIGVLLVYIFSLQHKKMHTFKFKDIPSFFLFALFFIFLFIGIGKFIEAGALGAIISGIMLRNLISKPNIKYIDSEIRTISYGFLAPIFLLSVGLTTDFSYLSGSLYLVGLVVSITVVSKVLTMYLVGRSHLGSRKSILAGIGLTVKLSTSIVILKLLLEDGLIGSEIYSVLIASSVIFTITVPLLLPYLIKSWKVHLTELKI